MLAWEWYDDKNTKILFLHILLKANYQDKKWHGQTIKRGEFITSQSHLAKEAQLTVRQVRTALDKLKMTGEVTIKTSNKYTHIKVNSYNDYQVNDEQEGNQMTIKGQSNDNQMTTTKEGKEGKESKEVSKDTEYGNSDINRFVKGITEQFGYSLPQDKKSRWAVRNILTLFTKEGKNGVKKGRDFLDDDLWANVNTWGGHYKGKYVNNGYGAQSWYKLLDHVRLWIANKGSYPN